MDKQSLQNNTMDNLETVHHILVIEDPTDKRTVELMLPNYSIGRHSDNDIVFSCQKMSRYHATLLRRTDLKNNQYSYWLLDGDLQGNKSRNGIFVNNKKCLIHELKDGDIIRFSAEAVAKYSIVNNLSDLIGNEDSFSLKKESITSVYKDDNKAIDNKQTLYTSSPEANPNTYSEQELIAFAELCPQPIIEIDLYGQIKFLNSAANLVFPSIYQQKLQHPLLKDLISQCNVNNSQILTRKVTINDKIYQQKACYFPGSRLIRSYISDLTQQQELKKCLLKQQAIYQTVTKKVSEGIIIVDKTTKHIVYANHYSSIILGYTVDELLTMTIFDLCFDREKLATNLLKAETQKNSLVGTYLLRHQNSSAIKVNLKIGAVDCENANSLYLMVGTVTEENDIPINCLETKKLTSKDVFYQQLTTAVANAKRYRKLSALMFLDLELLPEVEQNLANDHSNFLLSTIEERLRASLRSGDPVVLWQKNKFALLLSQIEAVEEAAKVCHRVQQSLKQSFKVGEHLINVNSNIGIAIYPQDGTELNVLLKNVDTALRRAQKNNDSYRFFNLEIDSCVAKILQMERVLERAGEREEFKLCYQPQASIDDQSILAIEVSIEWEHSESGEFSPTSFIRVAEQAGLIISIGEWIITTACMQSKIWQDRGLPPLKIIVNLSPVQFQKSSLPAVIERILAETEFDPTLLELNIVVETLMQDLEYSQQTMERLRKLGVKISLTNLATDLYSLKALKQFSFDTLKIEHSLIRELKPEPQVVAVISALVELGKGFNLDIVVEEVETEAQAELLRSFQEQRIQGFWSSPALSTAEMTKLLCDRYLKDAKKPE